MRGIFTTNPLIKVIFPIDQSVRVIFTNNWSISVIQKTAQYLLTQCFYMVELQLQLQYFDEFKILYGHNTKDPKEYL